jgi:hypothetical protein
MSFFFVLLGALLFIVIAVGGAIVAFREEKDK